jgi:hypothetical protein
MMRGDTLSRNRILELFAKLDAKMQTTGIEANIYVVGGAAIALTIAGERVTNDIDGYYENYDLDPIIKAVAKDEDLPESWLNHSINATLAYFKKDDEPKTVYVGKSLTIQVASPGYVLAMKLAARREKDIEDVLLIMRESGIETREELVCAVQRYFNADLSAAAHQRRMVEEFIDLIFEEHMASS